MSTPVEPEAASSAAPERVILPHLSRRYVYYHCAFFVIARLSLAANNLKQALIWLMNNVFENSIFVVKIKVLPNSLPPAGDPMADSRDILSNFDNDTRFGSAGYIRSASGRTNIYRLLYSVADAICRVKSVPFSFALLPEFNFTPAPFTLKRSELVFKLYYVAVYATHQQQNPHLQPKHHSSSLSSRTATLSSGFAAAVTYFCTTVSLHNNNNNYYYDYYYHNHRSRISSSNRTTVRKNNTSTITTKLYTDNSTSSTSRTIRTKSIKRCLIQMMMKRLLMLIQWLIRY